jgi:hypothetical protein
MLCRVSLLPTGQYIMRQSCTGSDWTPEAGTDTTRTADASSKQHKQQQNTEPSGEMHTRRNMELKRVSEECGGELRIAACLALCTCAYGTLPSLTWYTAVSVLAPSHESVGEVKVQLHTFLTMEVDGVSSFTPRPSTFSRYRLNRRLDWPQSKSGLLGELKYLTPLQETEPRVTLITIVTAPSGATGVLLLSYVSWA